MYRPAPAAATASASSRCVHGGQLIPRHAGPGVVRQVEVVVEEQQRQHRTGAHDGRLRAAVDEAMLRERSHQRDRPAEPTRAEDVHPHVEPAGDHHGEHRRDAGEMATDANYGATGRARSADQAAPSIRAASTGGPNSIRPGKRAQHRQHGAASSTARLPRGGRDVEALRVERGIGQVLVAVVGEVARAVPAERDDETDRERRPSRC